MGIKSLRFGLIGAGVAAETHAREMAYVEGGEIEAVYARDADKAAGFASAFGIRKSFDELGVLLADPAIDAVIITTPNGLHLDPAIAAARAGKHVIIEKPLEISEVRAKAIVAACREAGVRLQVIYQRRHSNAAQQALRDIAAGKLGKLLLVNIVDNQFRPARYYQKDAWRGTKSVEGGGCIITQATHLIDLAQYLAGPISAVYAHTGTAFHHIETEDVAVAVLEFANGALGTLSASTAAFPGLRHLLTICGTKGSIVLNGEFDQIVFRGLEGERVTQEVPNGFRFGDPIDPRDYPTVGQRKQLQVIVHSLMSEDEADPPIEDALRSVRVVDAIYESSMHARRVPISI
ncbi:Gfo/Idh/MocA family protein [Brucella intermedia]|uniref:Gfo/Idh/MocA family protein n=1 Tax=Brucella intermedia TaxID=94625 RepID=UPI00224A69BA|nr:Gfo/Idh/MocA family oxidoreductase [Brucella intermedia]